MHTSHYTRLRLYLEAYDEENVSKFIKQNL